MRFKSKPLSQREKSMLKEKHKKKSLSNFDKYFKKMIKKRHDLNTQSLIRENHKYQLENMN